MEKMGVLFLMGPSDCNDPNIPAYAEDFLKQLGEKMGKELFCADVDEWKSQTLPIFFIASGGAETGFKEAYQNVKPPYILLTVPAYNSLAAAMEILGYLDQHNLPGEILHGKISNIAQRIDVLERVAHAKQSLKGKRMGAIGEPSGLIASKADADKIRKACGMEIVDIDLEELVEEFFKGGYEENAYTEELKTEGFDTKEVDSALKVYGATKRLIEKYNLDGVTIKCFDLIPKIETTGCLALAILNSEGVPAACEGDTISLISMMIAYELTGVPSFMANPSSMSPETSEIVFAHCTLPITMPQAYRLTTHFESGIGVAVAGDMVKGPVTIFKCDDTLTRYYVGRAELVESMHRSDMCRTQMRLSLLDGTDYFAHRPICNHHMIIPGEWADVFDEFFASILA